MGWAVFLIKFGLFAMIHAGISIGIFLAMDRLSFLVQPGTGAASLYERIGTLAGYAFFFPVLIGDALGARGESALFGPSGTPRFFLMNTLIWVGLLYGIPSLLLRKLRGDAMARRRR